MLLITKSVPSHCSKSPEVVGAVTTSKLPTAVLNAILLDEPPAGKLNEPVNADAEIGIFAVHAFGVESYVNVALAPITSIPAPFACAAFVEPLAN